MESRNLQKATTSPSPVERSWSRPATSRLETLRGFNLQYPISKGSGTDLQPCLAHESVNKAQYTQTRLCSLLVQSIFFFRCPCDTYLPNVECARQELDLQSMDPTPGWRNSGLGSEPGPEDLDIRPSDLSPGPKASVFMGGRNMSLNSNDDARPTVQFSICCSAHFCHWLHPPLPWDPRERMRWERFFS